LSTATQQSESGAAYSSAGGDRPPTYRGAAQRTGDQVARAAQRLAQLRARQLLQEMRAAIRERERARRLDFSQRLALGAAVIQAGCKNWEPEQIVGLLAEHRARYETSPTVQAWLRQRGRQHLNGATVSGAKAGGPQPDDVEFPTLH